MQRILPGVILTATYRRSRQIAFYCAGRLAARIGGRPGCCSGSCETSRVMSCLFPQRGGACWSVRCAGCTRVYCHSRLIGLGAYALHKIRPGWFRLKAGAEQGFTFSIKMGRGGDPLGDPAPAPWCYRPRYLNIRRLNYLWTIRHSSAGIAGNLIT